MNLAALRAYTRGSVLKDLPMPRAWSDAELDLWLNEAQSLAARETGYFFDASSDITQLLTAAGTSSYALSPKILSVRNIIGPFGTPLMKVSANTAFFTSGAPRAWCQRVNGALFIGPVPDAAYALQLYVTRLPLEPMEVDSDTPELPEPYHTALCDLAGIRALANIDTQSSNNAAGMLKYLEKRWGEALVKMKREVYQNYFGG
jgi:hypothetical protein